jgi:SPP1 gp7 family putative phage head morphogenesis protein
MTDQEYIRELASAVTRQEDLTDDEARTTLLELALRIRALLLTLPNNDFARQLEYPRLRNRIAAETERAANQIFAVLRSRLTTIEASTLRTGASLFEVTPPAARPLGDVLQQTRIQTQSLLTLFTPSPTTGISPFAEQLVRLMDRSIRAAFFRSTPTPDLLTQLLPTRTRAGRTIPLFSKGSLLSGWRSRLKSIAAAAFWAIAFSAQQRAAALSPRTITGWRWDAVLDPKTCPICRPLDGEIRALPQQFPQGPPPVHPLCRCVLIPIYSD